MVRAEGEKEMIEVLAVLSTLVYGILVVVGVIVLAVLGAVVALVRGTVTCAESDTESRRGFSMREQNKGFAREGRLEAIVEQLKQERGQLRRENEELRHQLAMTAQLPDEESRIVIQKKEGV